MPLRDRINQLMSSNSPNAKGKWSADRLWYHLAYATVTYSMVRITEAVVAGKIDLSVFSFFVLIYLSIVAGSKFGSKLLALKYQNSSASRKKGPDNAKADQGSKEAEGQSE